MRNLTRREPDAPTMPCPACAGTGLDRVKAFTNGQSRSTVHVAVHVWCPVCEGRGRQTIARVLLDRSR